MKRPLALLLLMLTALPAAAQDMLSPGTKVAFLGLTFLDTSTEGAYFGENSAEATRIQLLEDLVTDRFTAEGITLLDLTAEAERLEGTVNPAKCYGCDTRMGTRLGADFVLVGEVQKVSNLILSMNLQLRDVETGETVMGRVVDIRSNTDDSWTRGMRYILKTAFFKEEEE